MARREAFPDSSQQLIAHIPIRVHPLLAAPFDRGRIRGRPILHICGECAGQLERLMVRSEEHTSELQSRQYLVCRLLLEKKTETKRWTTWPSRCSRVYTAAIQLSSSSIPC